MRLLTQRYDTHLIYRSNFGGWLASTFTESLPCRSGAAIKSLGCLSTPLRRSAGALLSPLSDLLTESLQRCPRLCRRGRFRPRPKGLTCEPARLNGHLPSRTFRIFEMRFRTPTV